MADIVIAALGSHGDVAPLTGVGVRLQQAGHRVTVTAYERFASLVRNCGIGFRGVFEPRESSDEADVDVTRALFQFLAPQGMRSLGTALLTALQDTPADILLLSPFSELAGHPLAEAKGIPSAGIRFQPYSATADFPPATLGGWSAGPTGNRLASRAGAELIDRLYGGVTAGFRRDFGLPKVSARRLREQRTKAGWTVLHGFSPHIVPRPTGWRPGLEICGYWWPQTDPQWRPPATLVDFLRAGPPPVYVGFGSTMASAKQSEHISQLVRSALRRAGMRGIVQAGWAGINVGDETTLTVTEVPHRWLFPHVAAVVHHCGAGTTAAGLRAGVPTVAVPGLGDQPFWARRLRDLGLSADTVPQRTLTVERLAAAIRTAVTDPGIKIRARRIADLLDAEDGAAHVVSSVDRLLG
ncbi:glycosyltransferase [Mycobacteroides abscessus]|uniref:glycosyltransferase n=1 Tax=Mycobacteroides abscessus TaxID=36809 RepID=UPI00092BC156|nr:glycosyltransferase [Mycobacteroides abscessus]SHT79797.1 glycosyltransferase [Mycobacteroides abscessus subsp. bolletii]SHX09219.1 glycosyltransferase [Mycobacteroides abscessus subsp. bolletii]SHX25962.1 glycosyltransferase [Mycobacteroides abscessus subsp. bolletii]SHX26282.1 glycosyltransferase [Mycobacteroides abscessus subsp. bolletii]SKS08353.1 glycosyltransferase [Mycobacteroides abscessus subsp. bolletii]